jgi:glycosyltransferase involved in cell wall biosynthesis
MDISIIICTYNRADNLEDCFDGLAAQEISSNFNWEVVLIDNNSSDHTRQFTQDYAASGHFMLRYTFESKQGLSHARNQGINASSAAILIFIDDDIRVGKNWLQSIVNTFNTQQCDAVGGRIHIESPAKLPKWITPDMYGFLGHQDFGDAPHPMDGYKEFPFGGNMAVRRSAFDKVGLFDTEMGRKGTGLKKEELFKGEEVDFFHRLADAGGQFYYQPDALVLHKILAHQLKPGFFLILHNNAGLLQARRDSISYRRMLLGVPFFVFPQFARAIGNYLRLCITKGANSAFRQLMNVAFFWGMIGGYYKKQVPKNSANNP